MKKFILLLVLMAACSGFSQNNTPKYMVVPIRFDFQSQDNQYNLNHLTGLMFEKYGFTVVYDNNILPQDLAENRCNGFYANIIKERAILTTNLYIEVRDCSGKVLFTSEVGKSKLKEYKRAYADALRKASSSLDGLNFKNTFNDTPAEKAPIVSKQPQTNDNLLLAQQTENGFNLVDSQNKVVLKMYKTSQPDSYTAQMESINGVVFKKNNEWFFEFYSNDKLVSQKLNIRF